MNSSEVLREMKELRQEWHSNNFKLSKEQKRRYKELLDLRHQRVHEMKNGVTG